MGPIVHVGFTTALLAGAKIIGYDVNAAVVASSFLGGVFLDGDKAIEIVVNREKSKRGEILDITARCRVLHSIFAFPFGLALSWLVSSWLPFIAVLLHIFADSFIPGLIENGKNYPAHSPLKWILVPFFKKTWYRFVVIGWPVTRAAKFNRLYTQIFPLVGVIMIIWSLLVCFRFAVLE